MAKSFLSPSENLRIHCWLLFKWLAGDTHRGGSFYVCRISMKFIGQEEVQTYHTFDHSSASTGIHWCCVWGSWILDSLASGSDMYSHLTLGFNCHGNMVVAPLLSVGDCLVVSEWVVELWVYHITLFTTACAAGGVSKSICKTSSNFDLNGSMNNLMFPFHQLEATLLKSPIQGPVWGPVWGPSTRTTRGPVWGPVRGPVWGPLWGPVWGPVQGLVLGNSIDCTVKAN